MSHFTALVLVRPDAENVEEEVTKLLSPFNENTDVEPYKSFLEDDDVENMRDYYRKEKKISADDNSLESLTPLIEDWHGHNGGIEEGKLYYETTYNPMSKWNWYVIGGRWDGALRETEDCKECDKDPMHLYKFHNHRPDALENNSMRVHELPEEFSSYAVITEHGWHEKGRMIWFGISTDEKDDWPITFKNLMKEHENHTAVLVDCHI